MSLSGSIFWVRECFTEIPDGALNERAFRASKSPYLATLSSPPILIARARGKEGLHLGAMEKGYVYKLLIRRYLHVANFE